MHDTLKEQGELLALLAAHGAKGWFDGPRLCVDEHYTQRTASGVISGVETVSLEPTRRAVMAWLGY